MIGKEHQPLLIFIHGGGVASWMWQAQQQYFDEKYECLFVTLEGHGNRCEERDFSIEKSAAEIITLIERHKKNRAVCVVGFSIGSQIALRCIERTPQLIEYAMINSALVKPMNWSKPFISPLMRMSAPLLQNRTFAKLQAKELYMDASLFEQYYAHSLTIKMETLQQVMSENMSFKLSQELRNSTTKVLITVGAQEKRIMRDSAKLIQEHFSYTKLIMVDNMKHGFPVAEAAHFNHCLESWLQENEK